MKFLILFTTLTSFAFAENIYIAENSLGKDTGTDAANAHSISWLKDANNWAGGASKIDPGDTIVHVGILVTPYAIMASGKAGFPITIRFSDGSKYSAPTWSTGGSSGLINATAKSFLVIERGTMEATANGQFLKYQKDWRGIYLTRCDNIMVRDMNFTNMYVRTNGDPNGYCAGVNLDNVGSNCVIENCAFTYAFAGAYAYFQGITGTNFTFRNNRATYCADLVVLGDGNAGSKWKGVLITGNYYDHSEVWGDAANKVHAEGIHLYAVNSAASTIDGVEINGNYFGPYTSGVHTTAHIFLDGNIIGSPLIANNVFEQLKDYSPSNGSIYNKCPGTSNIINNTFSSDGSGLAIQATQKGVTAKNNIVSQFREWIAVSEFTSDYNMIYGTTKSTTKEGPNSSTKNPLLSPDQYLLEGSPAIGTGANLSTLIKTDKNGDSRTVPWDRGAYKNAAFISPVEPPVVIPPAGAKVKTSVSTISPDGKIITTVVTLE